MKLDPDAMTWDVTCEPEDVPPLGMIEADDDGKRKAAECRAAEGLAAGNEWAWCKTRVVCRLPRVPEVATAAVFRFQSFGSLDDFLASASYAAARVAAVESMEKMAEGVLLAVALCRMKEEPS